MFNIGMGEMIVVAVVALFVFGPGKLPEVARAVGKGLREFRKAMQDVADDLNAEEIREVKESIQKDIKDVKHLGGSHGDKA
ncbi:Sec-independent protein translocase protein TatB [Megasphaera hexanoica]|jgi:sec-independent protein translocase protein TatA|uniref:Sec-independent protein translocase protein TatB n=1 Tax=Megasphaera TaxID=906 RepID=UPI000B3BB075|nr:MULTISPECIES: Sec-independent protein translocase protein TatB [Megasphaera]MBM6732101.1 twin-arginine translocase subunit TatB [Megasphaera stantonii]MDN0046419.1 Sec-independent protein translocase protein TatB [Megasphaera hexanoica]OUO45782.1 twin-arginine translocase subunit TatB [Megasphaera sp. An286]HJE83909.1 Sec-independent protein translocase protein TatB [Megasphaera stantonii]